MIPKENTGSSWPTLSIPELRKLKYTKIQGQSERKINFLRDGDHTLSTVPEIANLSAKTFSNTSSPNKYQQNFLILKNTVEAIPLNFISNGMEIYNKIFAINSLRTALSRSRNTSPDPDGIFYQMIKQLPDNMKEYILKVMNKY